MKAFYYVNKIFQLYGLESNTQTKLIKKLTSIVNIIILAYNMIVWTYFFFEIKGWTLNFLPFYITIYIGIISFLVYRRRHSKLYNLINQFTVDKEDKNIKKFSLILLLVWFIALSIMMCNNNYWAFKYIMELSKNQSLYTLKCINIALMENSTGIFLFGSGLMQILVYMQSYYILYCIKKRHFNNFISIDSENKMNKLQRIISDEFELRSIEEKLNELIGFIPIVWLTIIFIRICINITEMATNTYNIIELGPGSIDLYIYTVYLSTIIIIVGRLNNIYDINTITSIINKSFSTNVSNDLNLKLEIIQYLIESKIRCNNKPKPFGLFDMNSNLILGFVSSIVTFSVMFIQLKFESKPKG